MRIRILAGNGLRVRRGFLRQRRGPLLGRGKEARPRAFPEGPSSQPRWSSGRLGRRPTRTARSRTRSLGLSSWFLGKPLLRAGRWHPRPDELRRLFPCCPSRAPRPPLPSTFSPACDLLPTLLPMSGHMLVGSQHCHRQVGIAAAHRLPSVFWALSRCFIHRPPRSNPTRPPRQRGGSRPKGMG